MIFFISCIFNTIAMMTSCVVFITVTILPVSTYIGRYHIMIIVILLAAILGMATMIRVTLAFFGMDPTTITTDRVVTVWTGVVWSLTLGGTPAHVFIHHERCWLLGVNVWRDYICKNDTSAEDAYNTPT